MHLAPASRALRSLGLGALLALGAGVVPALAPTALAQSAAVPVLLPAGQKAEDWAEALAARGLVVSKGLPPAGASVVILDKRDYWEMTVRDWKGGMQTVNVAPAASAGEREDLVFYASTLLGPAPAVLAPVPVAPVPVVVPAPVAVATPPVTPSTPVASPPANTQPVTTAPATTAPATTAPVATAKPAPVTTASAPPASTAPASKPAPASSVTPASTAGASTGSVATTAPAGDGTGLWIGAGGGVGIRPSAGVVGDFRIDGGWHVTKAIRAGLGLAGRTEAALADAGAGRAMRDLDVVAQAAWVGDFGVRPVVGLYGGVSARTFTSDGTTVTDAVLPVLGGELGVQIPLGGLPLHLEPSVRLQGDLREVQIVSEAGTSTLSPVEVRAGLVLGYRAK